jgi:hypothetical protein
MIRPTGMRKEIKRDGKWKWLQTDNLYEILQVSGNG